MPSDLPLGDITRVIQLAVAPVFLLTAVGTILSVLSGRLARIVDRARILVERRRGGLEDREAIEAELSALAKRRRLVNLAITCGVATAFLVCLVIVTAFVGYVVHVHIAMLLAVLFISAMLFFMGALALFLREILVAVVTNQIK